MFPQFKISSFNNIHELQAKYMVYSTEAYAVYHAVIKKTSHVPKIWEGLGTRL